MDNKKTLLTIVVIFSAIVVVVFLKNKNSDLESRNINSTTTYSSTTLPILRLAILRLTNKGPVSYYDYTYNFYLDKSEKEKSLNPVFVYHSDAVLYTDYLPYSDNPNNISNENKIIKDSNLVYDYAFDDQGKLTSINSMISALGDACRGDVMLYLDLKNQANSFLSKTATCDDDTSPNILITSSLNKKYIIRVQPTEFLENKIGKGSIRFNVSQWKFVFADISKDVYDNTSTGELEIKDKPFVLECTPVGPVEHQPDSSDSIFFYRYTHCKNKSGNTNVGLSVEFPNNNLNNNDLLLRYQDYKFKLNTQNPMALVSVL